MQDIINIIKTISLQELKTVIFVMFPDSILLFFVTLKLYGKEINYSKLLYTALLLAPFNLIIRKSILYFGLSFTYITVLSSLVFILFTILFFRISIIQSLIVSFVIYGLTNLGDMLVIWALNYSGISIEQVFANILLNCLASLIENIYIIILALILVMTKFNLNKFMRH